MGTETECVGILNGQISAGKAYLETSEVLFRGEFRVAMKFTALTSVNAVDGVLSLETADDKLDLELGTISERWQNKIRNPKSLIDKLGIETGRRIAVLGVDDHDFLTTLTAVQPYFNGILGVEPFDIVFYAADSAGDLLEIPHLATCLAPKGALWVVARKGKAATVKDIDIIAAGRAAGMVDIKVASFSSTHSALKFVHRVK